MMKKSDVKKNDLLIEKCLIEYYTTEKLQHLSWLYSNIDKITSNSSLKGVEVEEIKNLIADFKKKYEELNNIKSSVIKKEPTKRRKTNSMDCKCCYRDREVQNQVQKEENYNKSPSYNNENDNKSPLYNRPYPESTNKMYGWYITQATPDYTTAFRDKKKNANSMFERSGLAPDPEHYKQAEASFL